MYVYLNNAANIYFIVLFGLVVGSFIGALTYRIPRNISILKGRSFCDSCKKKLAWYLNIPVFSYVFLRGKSACCHKKINIRYPVIELISTIGAVFLFINFSFPLSIIHYSLFIVSLAILIIDLEHQIIPDELNWVILLLFFLSPISYPLYANLFSGFLFALFLLLIHLITRGRGMGLGDVKLALVLGVWLGLYQGILWMFVSFLTGGIIASILLVTKKAKLKQRIAFGPFLIIGFWIIMLFF